MSKLEQLKQFVENIIDPTLKSSLKDNNAIESISEDNNMIVTINLALKNRKQDESSVKLQIVKYAKITLGYPGIKLNFSDLKINDPNKSKIKYIAIASGKGGVGKSSVTANLAVALSRLNKKVGIIDADVYGASIPAIFNLDSKPLEATDDDKLIPATKDGIQIVSTEFFMPRMQPLMWRGPMLAKLLQHFFEGVIWDKDTEYILIDLPPGTGDVTLDIASFVPDASVIIVTTSNQNASYIATKAGIGAKEIGHNILGVIENMSYYYNEASGNKEYLFGKGGGSSVASNLDSKLLAQIPISVVNDSNDCLYDQNQMNGKIYLALAKNITELLG